MLSHIYPDSCGAMRSPARGEAGATWELRWPNMVLRSPTGILLDHWDAGDKDMAQMGAIWHDNLPVWVPGACSYFVSPSSHSNWNVQSSKNVPKPGDVTEISVLNCHNHF